jgi:hypothetical protein
MSSNANSNAAAIAGTNMQELRVDTKAILEYSSNAVFLA